MIQKISCRESLVMVIISIFFLSISVLSAQEIKEGQSQPVVPEEKAEKKIEPTPTQEEKTVEKLEFQQRPQIKGYTYNLKRLLEQTQENIKKVQEEIKKVKIRKRNIKREAKAIEHLESGNSLYQGGKLKEARAGWQKALEISQAPEMKEYIKEAEERAKEQELARLEQEWERQKRLEQEQKEKMRKLKEKAFQEAFQEALKAQQELEQKNKGGN